MNNMNPIVSQLIACINVPKPNMDDIEQLIATIKNLAFCHIDERNSNEQTAMTYAIKAGHLEVVRKLIENGANVNSEDENSPLYVACQEGNFEIVDTLIRAGGRDLSKGADVNGTAINRPLHAACLHGHPKIVKRLTLSKADVIALNTKRKRALDIAFEQLNANRNNNDRYIECVLILLVNNAGIGVPDLAERLQNTGLLGALGELEPFIAIGSNLTSKHPGCSRVITTVEEFNDYVDVNPGEIGGIDNLLSICLTRILENPTNEVLKDLTRKLITSNQGGLRMLCEHSIVQQYLEKDTTSREMEDELLNINLPTNIVNEIMAIRV